LNNCNHKWQQIGIDLFRPALKVRCAHCQSLGEVLRPTAREVSTAFYASDTTPLAFDDSMRVGSANVETLGRSGH